MREPDWTHMQETMMTMNALLAEVAKQLQSTEKADKRAAVAKLRRIADLATTLAFTIESQR
jgi:hypothetical protein